MLTRYYKNRLIMLMFGIFLGVMIAKALRKPSEVAIIDYILIVLGLIVATIHYIPDKPE